MTGLGLDPSTGLALAALGLVAAFFAVRPEIWHRLFLAPIDPRPLGLMRIAFGGVVLWMFLSLGPLVRFLFTDEGMWLTDMARARYGAPLGSLGSLSVLHARSDPLVVFTLYAALLVALALMTAGVWTTWTTALSWLLVQQFYGYTPTALYGADRVVRVYLFLAMFAAWGEAYSVDSWRANRRAVLGGASALPARPWIAAWPARLMMLQLACIYCSSGLLKTGITWRGGTALYYVLNGDHLYRYPAQAAVTWLQHAGVLPLMTWLTRGWEMLFPVVLAGVALQGYERDRREGRWPSIGPARRRLSWLLAGAAWCAVAGIVGVVAARALAPGAAEPGSRRLLASAAAAVVAVLPAVIIPLYRLIRRGWPTGHHFLLHWLLGRRTWLGFGVLFHLGIEAGTNLGAFPQIMLAVYFSWLTGREVDWLVGLLFTRPLRQGEPGRPIRRAWWQRAVFAIGDRLRHRAPGHCVDVRYHPDDAGIRRAALVRLLAPRACAAFVADSTLPAATIRVESASAGTLRDRALSRLLEAVGRRSGSR